MSEGNGSTAMQKTDQQKTKPMVQDDGQFSMLLDTQRFEHMWRVAYVFSNSQMVPTHYQGKQSDCFIALEMAVRLGIAPQMFMQNTAVIHGKPSMEAKLVIALINSSGLFKDSLDFEIEGDDPFDKNYRVRAYAVRQSTGKTIYGPWVDWNMVQAEGWARDKSSKWNSIPGLMFQYRSAAFFGRLHCPERLMGMATLDEAEDIRRAEPISPSQLPKPGRHSLADQPEHEPEGVPTADDFPDQGAGDDADTHDTEPPAEPGHYDQDRAGEPEPPEEDGGGEPQSGRAPSRNELIATLKQRHGEEFADANERLKGIAADHYGRDSSKLTADDRRDIAHRIEDGEFDG